jgi:hypothetical protein
MGDRHAQRADELLGVLPDDGRDQLVVDAGARHGRGLQHPLGGLRERVHAREHQIPGDRRKPGALHVRREQLLGEERIALRPRQDLAEQHRSDRTVEDPGEQLSVSTIGA